MSSALMSGTISERTSASKYDQKRERSREEKAPSGGPLPAAAPSRDRALRPDARALQAADPLES